MAKVIGVLRTFSNKTISLTNLLCAWPERHYGRIHRAPNTEFHRESSNRIECSNPLTSACKQALDEENLQHRFVPPNLRVSAKSDLHYPVEAQALDSNDTVMMHAELKVFRSSYSERKRIYPQERSNWLCHFRYFFQTIEHCTFTTAKPFATFEHFAYNFFIRCGYLLRFILGITGNESVNQFSLAQLTRIPSYSLCTKSSRYSSFKWNTFFPFVIANILNAFDLASPSEMVGLNCFNNRSANI